MASRQDPIITPAQAYPVERREFDAAMHIRNMANIGIRDMELTKSALVAATYGVPHMIEKLKQLKATFRNELSCGGDK